MPRTKQRSHPVSATADTPEHSSAWGLDLSDVVDNTVYKLDVVLTLFENYKDSNGTKKDLSGGFGTLMAIDLLEDIRAELADAAKVAEHARQATRVGAR